MKASGFEGSGKERHFDHMGKYQLPVCSDSEGAKSFVEIPMGKTTSVQILITPLANSHPCDLQQTRWSPTHVGIWRLVFSYHEASRVISLM
jgi:hypothetical protein